MVAALQIKASCRDWALSDPPYGLDNPSKLRWSEGGGEVYTVSWLFLQVSRLSRRGSSGCGLG